MIHVKKFTTENIGQYLIRGAGCILSDLLYKKSDGFVALSNKSMWNNLDYVCQSNPILPCLFNLKNVIFSPYKTDDQIDAEVNSTRGIVDYEYNSIDYYTLNIKNVFVSVSDKTKTSLPVARIFGQYVIGDFEDVLFPIYDPQQDNMLTDTLASSIASCLKDDYQSAYAYLRLSQMFIEFAREQKDFIAETDANKRQFSPTLFKL